MAKIQNPAHVHPFSEDNPRPQCPAEMHPPFGVMPCHLLFGHDGPHIHYTAAGNETAFVTDEREGA